MGPEDRIRRLENRGDECLVCGWGPDMEVVFTWEDGWDDDMQPKEPEPVEPEYCPRCGRPDHVVIYWPEDAERRQHEAAMRRLREGAATRGYRRRCGSTKERT